MPQDYYSLVTNQGLIKEAASNQAGGLAINLTEMAIGDGNGNYYDPNGSEISLVNEVHRVNLTHVVVDENNTNQLMVEAVLDETIGPFYIREVGIFDSNGDLFAIGKYPETFKPNLPAGSGKRLYIRMILGFANSPNVDLIINNDISLDPNFGTDVNNALDNLNQELLSINNSISQINSVPTGSIFALSTINIPDGYLECDGSEINRTTYNNLFGIISSNFGSGDGSTTFNLPDLRGEFIRGFDNGRGVDSGRSFASYQGAEVQSHNHSITLSMRTGGVHGGYNGPHWSSEHIHHGSGTAYTSSYGSSETRPRNISLKYIIKY